MTITYSNRSTVPNTKMEFQQPSIKVEASIPDQPMLQDLASDSPPTNVQKLPTTIARQRTCTVAIQDIPDGIDLVTILNSEPQWSEGLISMAINQGPPRTATLAYAAAAFAEALLFRCAKSLCGLKLSLAMQQAVHSEDQVTRLQPQAAQIIAGHFQVNMSTRSSTLQMAEFPSINASPNLADQPAPEISNDDCIVLSSNPVKKSNDRRISNPICKTKALSRANTDARKSSSEKMSSPRAGTTSSSSSPMTKDQQKSLMSTLQTLSRRKDAIYFAQPVTYNQMRIMNIPHYPDIIKKPMDLRTMEEKLKSARYQNVDDLIADFSQIVDNTIKFNGPGHQDTQDALRLKVIFDCDIKELLSKKLSTQIKKAQPLPTGGRPRKWQNIEVELQKPQKRKRSLFVAMPGPREPDSTDSDDIPLKHYRMSRERPAKDAACL